MKEIDDIELNEVAGGRALNAEERYVLSQFNDLFNQQLREGKLSKEDIANISKQANFYSRFMGLIEADDRSTYLFNLDEDWEKLYKNQKEYLDFNRK